MGNGRHQRRSQLLRSILGQIKSSSGGHEGPKGEVMHELHELLSEDLLLGIPEWTSDSFIPAPSHALTPVSGLCPRKFMPEPSRADTLIAPPSLSIERARHVVVMEELPGKSLNPNATIFVPSSPNVEEPIGECESRDFEVGKGFEVNELRWETYRDGGEEGVRVFTFRVRTQCFACEK